MAAMETKESSMNRDERLAILMTIALLIVGLVYALLFTETPRVLPTPHSFGPMI
jgi:hypothetical protein